eukprot:TRINITY_DN4019_c0_g1_i9.p1 TRINITY_DN4019_c0_g1~~TRINITY_DN4019_c0_g1_i9.p1  ORF type:complete len:443 (-),score=88.91 TRINITY_DN4019_c0_g1_i9:1098-2426(-)
MLVRFVAAFVVIVAILALYGPSEKEFPKHDSAIVTIQSPLHNARKNAVEMENALQSAPFSNRWHLSSELAQLYSLLKRPNDALALRQTIVEHYLTDHGASVATMVELYASMALDARNLLQYDRSLSFIRQAGAIKGIDAQSASILLKLESSVFECKGDPITALQRFEQSQKLAAGDPLTDGLLHLDLLKRVLRLQPAPPSSVLRALQSKQRLLETFLLHHGPWVHAMQLPKVFVDGLTSRPWHNITEHYPQLQSVADLMIQAAPALRQEFHQLKRTGKLFAETECIHDAAGGMWKQYSVNGYWLQLDENGCSVDTPVSCALLLQIQLLHLKQFRIIRAGFSAVDAMAYLQPHCGLTNAQLKFHLGLIVPQDAVTAQPCASMRVGNETRQWHQDQVLFFDDSWEHEVWNRCNAERVVFQLVFMHPEFAVRLNDDVQTAVTAGH